MYVVKVVFKIKPEEARMFKSLVLKKAEDSIKAESECHNFEVLQDDEDTSTFHIHQEYKSSKSYDVHLLSLHFNEFERRVKDMVLTKEVSFS